MVVNVEMLKLILNKKGITVRQLADMAQIKRGTAEKILEFGSAAEISLKRIAEGLGVPYRSLLYEGKGSGAPSDTNISPCENCETIDRCTGTPCIAWSEWFKFYWRGFRKEGLEIIARREKTCPTKAVAQAK